MNCINCKLGVRVKIIDDKIKLFKKKKLPSTILLNGQKGLGKATFAFHYINYLKKTWEC